MHLPPTDIFGVVSVFACANELPNNLDTHVWPAIRASDVFKQWRTCVHWPWTEFIINLAILNCFDQEITKDAIQQAILHIYATVNPKPNLYANVLKLYQIYRHNEPSGKQTQLDKDVELFIEKSIRINAEQEFAELPLNEIIKEIRHDKCVINKVITKYGHCIQHLMIHNIETNKFKILDANFLKDSHANRTELGYILLDDIILNENERL